MSTMNPDGTKTPSDSAGLDPSSALTGRPGHLGVAENIVDEEVRLGRDFAPAEGEIPPLPEDATPEERELHWYRYVYQGDHVKQLSLRAVLMGGVLGMFMAISNLYTTLKLGWSFGVTITACVLSYVIWNSLRAITGKWLTPMTVLENNCMQSTASAAGSSTGSTVATAFGALLLINGYHQNWYIVLPFVFFTATLGVFLAIPMKRQMINIEQLKFPTGIASAETLRSLYSHGDEALRKAYSLVAAMVFGAVIGLLRVGKGTIGWLDAFQNWIRRMIRIPLRIPELIPFTGILNPLPKGEMQGLGFEPSVLLIGAGMIVGLRVSLSMLAGSVLLYYVVSPALLAHDAAMSGVADYVPSFRVAENGDFYPVRWSLWAGTAVLVFSSLASVALQWRTIARSFSIFRRGSQAGGPSPLARIEVPTSWLVAGLIPAGIGMVIVQYLAFKISLPLGIIAVAMSFVISLVCCRATGETDTTPIGPMGKVTQFLYALLAQGNTTVNLMSAGATSAAGGAAADLLTDLKSGYILGANARKQFLAQFFGVFFGTLIVVPAWYLMVPDKAALEAFHPPATTMWHAVAMALTQGLHSIPMTAQYGIAIGALFGMALPLVAVLVPKSRPFLPSAMGLGLGWVVPFQNSFAFAIGAVVAWLWERASKRSAETYVIPVASGLVAGESLMAAFVAIWQAVPGVWHSIVGKPKTSA